MQIVILLPAFLAFLYTLYKLVKDDYIFIRKNVSAENMFDTAFVLGIVSIFTSRIVHFLLHPLEQGNSLLLFFTAGKGGFSLLGAILGSLLTLYCIGRYKKWPPGRLFDFITLAFVVALPVGLLSTAIFLRDYALWLHLGMSVFYLILMLWFLRFLYPRLMSRTLREGTISVLFLCIFSITSLLHGIFLQEQGKIVLVDPDVFGYAFLFFISVVLVIKQASSGLLNKKR